MTSEVLQRLYDLLPSVGCKGLCTSNCTIIPISEVEASNMQLSDEERIEFPSGVIILNMVDTPQGPRCSKLKDGRCTSYDTRPLICRLYGAVDGLQCPYGCRPSRELTKHEIDFIRNSIYGPGWERRIGEVVRLLLG